MSYQQSQAFAGSGTRLFMSVLLPTTFDSVGFEDLIWTEVGSINSIGEFGKEYEVISVNPLNTRRTEKILGNYDEGELTLQLNRQPADDGQDLLRERNGENVPSAFRIVLSDPDQTVVAFLGKVAGYRTGITGSGAVVTASTTIAIDSEIIEYTLDDSSMP